jgi:hypothetical protein
MALGDDWPVEPYDSGPYCRHWFDPFECEQCRAGCATCGHSGLSHSVKPPSFCEECHCREWVDKADWMGRSRMPLN